MKLTIVPKGAGKYSVTDDKERVIYTVTKAKKIFGNPVTTLHDANGYALYTMRRTSGGKKPAFQVEFNDEQFMTIECKSFYVDPCLAFSLKDGTVLEAKGKRHAELSLYKGKDAVGKILMERQANNEEKYILEVDTACYDDYMPLFAVAVDKSFGSGNK